MAEARPTGRNSGPATRTSAAPSSASTCSARCPKWTASGCAAYGNSMGAYLTIGLAAEQPEGLAAAAITAGGINPAGGFAAPSRDKAAKIKIPICILHGSSDTTVRPEQSALLESVLKENKVECQRHVYEGIGHNLHAEKSSEVIAKVEAWFKQHAKTAR